MNKNKLKQRFGEYFSIVFTTTKNYKIVTIVELFINVLFSITLLQTIITVNEQYAAIVVRALLDTVLFFVITHVFIRSYLKINILNEALNWQKIWPFLVYLIAVSTISLLGTIAIGQIEMLKFTDVNSFQLTNDEGVLQFDFSKINLFMFGIVNNYMMFIVWAIVYLFFHQQINRKKQQKEMHQAQLQQLTNQLNPHFLFNALNSIRALIYEDKDKAADTVTQLSELFRTHLQAHLKAQSTLEDEWQVSSRYLAIEGIRLEERLQLVVDIDDELLLQKLPTLTLLTLVENAIKHGVSPNSETGEIVVKAFKTSDKCWQLIVINSVNQPTKADGTNTGINNIKQRCDLMFGNRYKWSQSKVNNYFEVKMELPLA